MVDKIPQATDALVRTIRTCCHGAPKVAVTEARPGWRFEDLLGDRVNVYLFRVAEDRIAANDAIPSRPVTLSYLVTFYGKGAGGDLELVMGRMAKSALLDGPAAATDAPMTSGLFARVDRTGPEEMARIWSMFRRKYALSIVVDVTGTVLG
jgi:hypothetical protein